MSDKLPKDVQNVIRDIAGESIIAKLNLENLAHFMLSREEVIAEGWVQPEHLQISKEQGVRLVITKKSYHSSAIPVKLIRGE